MTIEEHASVTISIGTLCALVVFIVRHSMNYGALNLKVDTMWAFQMRRAQSEIVEGGHGTKNSPLSIMPEVQQRLEPIRTELETFGDAHHALCDGDFLLKIEEIFGPRLLDIICIPCKMSHGACLLVAMSVAKKTQQLDLHF